MSASTDTAEVSSYRKTRSTDPSRRGFGLMLGVRLRRKWFSERPDSVVLELEGVGPIIVALREGFWKKCPEFLADEVYDWIVGQGLSIPWDAGKPHRFKMERLSANHFRVLLQA